jgi:hypothetical protein
VLFTDSRLGLYCRTNFPNALDFNLLRHVQTGSEVQPASYTRDNKDSVVGGKRQECEGLLHHSSADIKNVLNCSLWHKE